MITEAFHAKIPEFQKNSPLLQKTSARVLSGFSVKVLTLTGLSDWAAALPPVTWM